MCARRRAALPGAVPHEELLSKREVLGGFHGQSEDAARLAVVTEVQDVHEAGLAAHRVARSHEDGWPVCTRRRERDLDNGCIRFCEVTDVAALIRAA